MEKKVNNAIKELKSAGLLDEKITTELEVQEAKRLTFLYFQKQTSQKTQENQ